MQIPTTIAIVALGLLFMAGTANANHTISHSSNTLFGNSTGSTGAWIAPSISEQRKARERNEWIDRERARQEIQSYNRQQDKLLYDAQRGTRFLDSLGKPPRESAPQMLDRLLRENRRRY